MKSIEKFIHHEAASGVVLMAAAALALVLVNAPWGDVYATILQIPVVVKVGDLGVDKPLLLWINDGLMAVFFLIVGLEIKRELLVGSLASRERAMLPGIAAVGGMAVPAVVYLALNAGDPALARGWAIPAATDIAFALGVLALLGPRAPGGLRVFLLALAIIDDLGAILIIAAFYTSDLSLLSLGLAGAACVGLAVLNRVGVRRLAPYLWLGVFVWVTVLKSGVHATLAGVVVAMAIPLGSRPGTAGDADTGDEAVTGNNGSRTDAGGANPDSLRGTAVAPLDQLMQSLHPWVAFVIMPLFAFANAGLSLRGLSLADLAKPLPLGIAAGLFVGKQVGVMVFTGLVVRLGWGRLPVGSTWASFYGVAVLTGIGFTMSLFIGSLAFPDPSRANDVRLGVLAGSLVSAVVGFLILRWVLPPGRRSPDDRHAAGVVGE